MAPLTINVKCANAKKYTISVPAEGTVPDLKAAIETASEIPPAQQRLIFKGKVLKDEETLAHYALEDEATVHLVRALSTPSSTTAPAPAATTTHPPTPSPAPTATAIPTNPFAALPGMFGGMNLGGGGQQPQQQPAFQAGANPLFGGFPGMGGMGGMGGFQPPTPQQQAAMQQQLVSNPEMMAQIMDVSEMVGGWVGGWIEENEAVRMSYCGLCMGGWVVWFSVSVLMSLPPPLLTHPPHPFHTKTKSPP